MHGDAGDDRDTGLTRAEWPLLLVLAAVQFTHSMDFMVLMPLGPQCRQELGISPQEFALVVGAYGFSAALAGLLAAWFIDRFDRKTALLLLYAGFTTGTLLCAVAPGYGSLLLARALAGAFGGTVAALILVIIGDAFPERRRGRATGVVMTSFSVASIAGLPAGILLGNRFGVRTPFAVLGVLSITVSLLASRVLRPLRGHLDHRRASAAATWSVLTQPAHLRAFAFMVMLVLGSFTIAPHFSDYLVHHVGREKDDLSYVYLCGGLLTFVTLPQIGRWADRFGKRITFRLLALSTILILLVLSNLPPAPLVPVLVVTTLYWVVTSGRWVPAMAMITSSALPHYRGRFMSVNASVQQMACGLSAVIAGVVIGEGEDGALTGYPLAGLIAAGATTVSIVLAGRLRLAEQAPEASVVVDGPGDALGPALDRVAEAAPLANGENVAGDPVV
ncbi:MAG: MFS transporter [Gemmataceae bacterium]|nr:MFS transporter [Gemmataceae bacterium]